MNDKFTFLTAKPEITVEQVVGWEYALDASRFTVGKTMTGKVPSETFIRRSIMAEHSPIKLVQYRVIIRNLHQWVGVHLLRHEHVLPYICSQRNDRNATIDGTVERINSELLQMIREEEPDFNPRNLLPQGANNDHLFWLNAQTLINISRRRLCHEASRETREVWTALVEALRKVDPILPDFLVPMCIYRGFCPEFETCGYCLGAEYYIKLENYRKQIADPRDRLKHKQEVKPEAQGIGL